MTNPYIERAAKVMDTRDDQRLDAGHSYPSGALWYEELARTLDSAGLLRTPLHERALEACEEYATRMGCVAALSPFADDLVTIGRESLALKEKAKVTEWVAVPRPVGGGKWAVCRNVTPILFKDAIYKSDVMGDDFTESQARRVAAVLNEGDES